MGCSWGTSPWLGLVPVTLLHISGSWQGANPQMGLPPLLDSLWWSFSGCWPWDWVDVVIGRCINDMCIWLGLGYDVSRCCQYAISVVFE